MYFSHSYHHTELHLANNQLTTLPAAFSRHILHITAYLITCSGVLTSLRLVDLSHNTFTELPDVLHDIASLQTVKLVTRMHFPRCLYHSHSARHNQITSFNVERLSALPQLQAVDVRNNPVQPDTRAALLHLSATVHLDE